jgi:ATP-dependent helicase/DNAse subunit B
MTERSRTLLTPNPNAEFNPGLVLISGPPASGKSSRVLAELREALRARDWSAKLLVPSATMSEHVRNELAREGLLLRRGTVQTLTRFLSDIPGGLPAPSAAQADLALREILARYCPAEFEPIRESAGLRRLLLECAEALSLAKADPQRVPGAVGIVYRHLLGIAARDAWALRGQRLTHAAQSLAARPMLPCSLLLDGFFNFAPAELDFLEALAKSCRVVVSLATLEDAEILRRPCVEILSHASVEQEVLGIAAEVRRLIAGGVEPRRIGVLLRNPGEYMPLIENAFSRLAIPSRSYLGQPLGQHPLTVFLRNLRAAEAAQWDAASALAAFRTNLTGLASSEAGDRLEWRLREAMPAPASELRVTLTPYAEAFRLLAAPHDVADDDATAFRWRELCDAMRVLARIFESVDDWDSVEAEIETQTLRERDRRRQVVHLMDLHEARQWELDYVFAPGLLEGEFPRRPQPDPLLSEDTRAQLGLKTLPDRDKEEQLLWRVLTTRAKQQLTLSYPRRNAKGDPLTPSPWLPNEGRPAPASYLVALAAPREAALLGQTAGPYRPARAWSATEFETYLSCPFQHFARYGLRLESLPPLPPERLDHLFLGNAAHKALQFWHQSGGQLEDIAVRVYDEALLRECIPAGYRVELERLNLARIMRLAAKKIPPIEAGWQAHLEEEFAFDLDKGVKVQGRIDRFDLSPLGLARAFDYKYSRGAGLEEKYVQGGIYALALRAKDEVKAVESFSYVALKQDAQLTPFAGDVLEGKLKQIQGDAKSIVQLVAQGAVPVRPADRDNCQYCDYQDVCRIRTLALAEEDEEALTA